MKSFFSLLLALAGTLLLFPEGLHAQTEEPTVPTEETTTDDYDTPAAAGSIATIVSNSPDHTSLAAALQAADLTSALEEDGNLILMAPTNAAFATLPEGILDALLQPENADALTQLLQYHVVSSADDVSTAAMTELLQNNAVSVGESIAADNGVVYPIDQVLLPEDMDLNSLLGER